MPQLTLSPNDWTQIVAPGGTDRIEVRSMLGSFLTSLNTGNEVGAATVTQPPVPPLSPAATSAANPSGPLWSKRQIEAGIAVFAKAINGPAIANVAPAPK